MAFQTFIGSCGFCEGVVYFAFVLFFCLFFLQTDSSEYIFNVTSQNGNSSEMLFPLFKIIN